MDNKPNAYSDSVVTPKEKDPLENPGTNWRKTLTGILKTGCEGVKWIYLAQI
jgi:hypothetical protein